jgi:amidophosphoribosyltransferase
LPRENFCLACFTGDYPVPVQLEMDKLAMETQHGVARGKDFCEKIEGK